MKFCILPLLFLFMGTIFFSCKKNVSQAGPTGKLNINVSYNFDGKALLTDTFLYTNAAGYKMSVTTLDYYISGLTFYHADSSKITLGDVHYVSISDSGSNHFTCAMPNGNYVALKFYIGLDSIHNQSGDLPSTPDNLNMAWPDLMGGGYHFLKLEGYYIDKSGTPGYTVHVGSNMHLIKTMVIKKPFSVNNSTANINLGMNIDNWFKSPYLYDFDKDGNFTMNSDTAMAKIAANGYYVFN